MASQHWGQLHSTLHSKEQEFQNPCLHLVSGMTCSFSVPVVFFLLWKQGLRVWTSVPVTFQGRCHKIKSRLYEKCYLALNLVAKMQRYILKTLHLKGCPHQGPNWTQRFPKGKHISDWKPHPYQWSRIHYRGVSQLRHCGQGRKGGWGTETSKLFRQLTLHRYRASWLHQRNLWESRAQLA